VYGGRMFTRETEWWSDFEMSNKLVHLPQSIYFSYCELYGRPNVPKPLVAFCSNKYFFYSIYRS
jgi:hypothetical protein